MGDYKIQTLETAITLVIFFAFKFTARYFIKSTVSKALFKAKEEKEITRLFNLFISIVILIIIAAIWGMKQNEILLFATSLVTILGVALFAEMSILSNITACLVLFFQHPIKIGDNIIIFNDDKKVEGELIDITYFFVFIKTFNDGIVTIPNSLFLKSSFVVSNKKEVAN